MLKAYAGVTTRRDRAWLMRYISDPAALLAAGDPGATALFHKYKQLRMPNLKLGAGDAGVAAIVSYLEAQAK